MVNVKVEIHLE